jgi:hypothetical protein
MPDRPGHFHRHRFPAEVISYAVWQVMSQTPSGAKNLAMARKILLWLGPEEVMRV